MVISGAFVFHRHILLKMSCANLLPNNKVEWLFKNTLENVKKMFFPPCLLPLPTQMISLWPQFVDCKMQTLLTGHV